MDKEKAIRFAGLMEDYLNIPSFVCEMIQQQLEENKYKEVVEYVVQRRNEIESKPEFISDRNAITMLVNQNEQKDKEIERLKAREEEITQKYLSSTKYASEIEGKYVVDEYIIDKLEKYFEKEQIRLARENSNIYKDSLGKTKLVNDDIFNEITRIKDKLKELKENKDSNDKSTNK